MEKSFFLHGVIALKFYLSDTGLICVTRAQRRQQTHIQIQTIPVRQWVGNGRLWRLSGQACWQRYRWNLHVNCPRIPAAGQQLQQAQADERNHHSQQQL